MITVFLILAVFFLICLQSTFLAYYLTTFLTAKVTHWKFLIISFFAVVLTKISINNHQDVVLDFRFLFFLILIALEYFCFEGDFYKKIFHFLFLSCLFLVQNEFLQSLTHSQVSGRSFIFFIVSYIFVTAFAFVFVAVLQCFVVKNTLLLNRLEYLILSIFPLISIVLLVPSWQFNTKIQAVLAITILIFNTVNFYFYNYLGAKNFLIQQQDIMTMQNDFHADFLRQQQELQVLRHDLKNMLLEIDRLAVQRDFNGIEQIVKNIQGTVSLNVEQYSGCFVIDSVLSHKIAMMKAAAIPYSLNLMIPSDLDLQEKNMDICAILGNLLDNAIEEMQRNKSQETVEISLYFKDENLVFQINNTTTNAGIVLTGASVASSKKSNRSGIGIASIRERVINLQGYSSFNVKKGIFEALVSIPLPEKNILVS